MRRATGPASQPQGPASATAELDLLRLPRAELERMAEAGHLVLECERVLAKTGDTVVDELLRGHAGFFEWDHYPPGEVHDPETGALYYYHAHPPEGRDPDEHGHFHTFLKLAELPAETRPLPLAHDKAERPGLAHLVAIAMDRQGRAYRLFTTNRWVTGESWFRGQDLLGMVDRFIVGHARPSWPVNLWLTAMVGLFRPQIGGLIATRDRTLAAWARRHPGPAATEDRRLEILSSLPIAVPEQLRAVEGALASTAKRR